MNADGALVKVARHQLRLLWSVQRIARERELFWPNCQAESVSHATIYSAICVHPHGARKREITACLSQRRREAKPITRVVDRRNQEMQSILIRPLDVKDSFFSNH